MSPKTANLYELPITLDDLSAGGVRIEFSQRTPED